MALANVAALLARLGKKVLVVDWDLEAPGLERYFGNHLQGSRRSSDGLIDITDAFARGERMDWRGCLLQAVLPQGVPIDILHAGRDGDNYAPRLRAANWEGLFANKFGNFLDEMRTAWINDYDYVLIDSRTGITDIGGICTIFMPDYLISMFTTNAQSVQGVRDTMARARDRQSELPLKRRRMVIIPLAARDESANEYRQAAEWRRRAAATLDEFYLDWIHKDESAESVLDYLKIPYVAYWSFGERLPVLEEDPQNPKNLAYSYSLVTRLIHTRLDWGEVREGRKITEQQQQRESEVQTKLAEAAQTRAESQARLQAQEKEELSRRESLVFSRYFDLLGIEKRRSVFHLAAAVALGLIGAGVGGVEIWYLRLGYTLDPIIFGASGISLLAAVAFSLLYLRSVRKSEHLRREETQYQIRGGHYAGRGSAEALVTFAARIESIADWRLSSQVQFSPAMTPAPAPPPSAGGPPGSLDPGFGMALPPPPPPGTLGVPPAVAAQTDQPVDVFVDYTDVGIVRDWMREFVPLLRTWLSESAGRDVGFAESTQMPPGADWSRWARERMARASLVVVIATPRYLASADRMSGLSDILRGERSQSSVFVLTLDRNVMEQAPGWLRDYQTFDFSDLAYVGEGFSKSERYIEFQDRVRKLAAIMADEFQSKRTPPPPPAA